MATEMTEEMREARQDGRDEAATLFPLVDDQGFQRGWAAHANHVATKLRKLARDDPAARSMLLEILDD